METYDDAVKLVNEQKDANKDSVLTKLSHDDVKYLYARFKYIQEGICNIEKPSMLNLLARGKYDAWKSYSDDHPDHNDKSIESAKKEYLDKVQSHLKKKG